MDQSREDQVKFAKHFEHAQGWLLLDKFDLAAKALAEVPAGFTNHPDVMHLSAQIHMAAGQWSLAEPFLRRLRESNSSEPLYWVNLAYVVRRAKSLAEAEPILIEARLRFPAEAMIWFNLACYASQQGRLVESRNLLTEAIRLDSSLEEAARTDPDFVPYWEGLVSGQITPAPS